MPEPTFPRQVRHCVPARSAPDDWTAFALPVEIFLDFPPGSRVLDVGCGPGVQLAELTRRGCRATGADVSAIALNRARSGGLRVIAAKAEALPLRDGSVDGVLCKV